MISLTASPDTDTQGTWKSALLARILTPARDLSLRVSDPDRYACTVAAREASRLASLLARGPNRHALRLAESRVYTRLQATLGRRRQLSAAGLPTLTTEVFVLTAELLSGTGRPAAGRRKFSRPFSALLEGTSVLLKYLERQLAAATLKAADGHRARLLAKERQLSEAVRATRNWVLSLHSEDSPLEAATFLSAFENLFRAVLRVSYAARRRAGRRVAP